MKKSTCVLILLLAASFSSPGQTITWSPAMDIASGTYENQHPRIVTDRSGDPLVIWGRSSDESVFFSKWNGSGFTTPVKINPTGVTVATAAWMGPDIAAKGDTMYIVMKETPESANTKHVLIVRSVDGGTTFSAPVQVDNIADSLSRFPVVATDDPGNPVVGFMKFDASFGNARWAVAKSVDFGNSFAADNKASGWSGTGALVCDCCPGSLVCSGSTAAMLYRDNLSNIRDMWGGISADAGSSFTQGLSYDQGNWLLMSCPSSGPDGAIIGDTLYTTYMSGSTGDELVYTNKSSLTALAGSPGIPVTGQFSGLTQQNFPRMANAGNALATVWRQSVSGSDYLISRFTADVTGGIYVMDTIAGSGVMNGDVTLTDGKLFAVWQDYNSGTVKYRMGSFSSMTGIAENAKPASFSVYPNPADNHVNIILSSSFGQGSAEITVINTLGKEIFSSRLQPVQGSILLDTEKFSGGVYFITVRSGKKTSTKKIIINNQ